MNQIEKDCLYFIVVLGLLGISIMIYGLAYL